MGARKVFFGCLFPKVIGHTNGHLGSHIAHYQRILKVIPKVLGNLTAHVKNFIDRLTGTLKSSTKVVHEAHQASTTFPVV